MQQQHKKTKMGRTKIKLQLKKFMEHHTKTLNNIIYLVQNPWRIV